MAKFWKKLSTTQMIIGAVVVIAICVGAFLLLKPGKKCKETLEGVWEGQQQQSSTNSTGNDQTVISTLTITLNKDKTVTANIVKTPTVPNAVPIPLTTGTWKLEGNKIIIINNEAPVSLTYTPGANPTITLVIDNKPVILKKKC